MKFTLKSKLLKNSVFLLIAFFALASCKEDIPQEPSITPNLLCYFIDPGYPMKAYGETETVVVEVGAETKSGYVTEVSLFLDGNLCEVLKKAPYKFKSIVTSVGIHTLEAVAVHSAGIQVTTTTSFSIGLKAPTITTSNIREISFESVVSGGTIVNDGGSPILKQGICWGTLPLPDIFGEKLVDESETASFSDTITGLIPGTKYYLRAYASNAIGITYGEQKEFNTFSRLPKVLTLQPTTVDSNLVVIGGEVLDEGEAVVVERGLCWNTVSKPTILNNKIIVGSGSGSFSDTITGLTSSTIYYIRAYATNSKGTVYGEEIVVTTLNE